MKTQQLAPHDVVKSYVKVAQDRLKEVFFIRPEWRKAKSAHQADWIIGRIDEIYYPFSSKDKHMIAVWKQVLKEKREEMIEELQTEKQTKNNNMKAGADVAEPVRLTEPGLKGYPGAQLPTNIWPPARIADLKQRIKGQRLGSRIARELRVTPATVNNIVSGRGVFNESKRNEWLDKIEAALQAIEHDHTECFTPATAPDGRGLEGMAMPAALASFPQAAKTLISNMSVDVVAGKMHVVVTVDIEEALRLAVQKSLTK